jgi:large subunit ribosomal protein L21
MTYAIISLGGKQYRVQEGQRLLVDRLAQADGKTFHPTVLFVGGNGKSEFSPKGTQVTAKVLGSALGDKIRIGKYKKRTGYKRHTGHRAKLTQIEITAIGASRTATKPKAEPKAETAEKKPAAKPKAEAAPQSSSDAQTGKAAAQSSSDAQTAKAAAQSSSDAQTGKAAARAKAPAKPRAAKPKAEAAPKEETE